MILARTTPDGDEWVAGVLDADGTKTALVHGVRLETAQGVAEDYVRRHGVAALVKADAKWRKRPPTAKALDAAKRWHLPVDPTWNAGQLSDALDAHIAKIEARKAKP